MSISVYHWGSHPDKDNDDCWCGEDFATEAEAVEFYHIEPEDRSVQYIEIDLDEADCIRLCIERIRLNPKFIPSKQDSDDEWKRESAMQAGMAFGVHGYNDVMGYDSEEYVPESYR